MPQKHGRKGRKGKDRQTARAAKRRKRRRHAQVRAESGKPTIRTLAVPFGGVRHLAVAQETFIRGLGHPVYSTSPIFGRSVLHCWRSSANARVSCQFLHAGHGGDVGLTASDLLQATSRTASDDIAMIRIGSWRRILQGSENGPMAGVSRSQGFDPLDNRAKRHRTARRRGAATGGEHGDFPRTVGPPRPARGWMAMCAAPASPSASQPTRRSSSRRTMRPFDHRAPMSCPTQDAVGSELAWPSQTAGSPSTRGCCSTSSQRYRRRASSSWRAGMASSSSQAGSDG